jgi:hypothetical protein
VPRQGLPDYDFVSAADGGAETKQLSVMVVITLQAMSQKDRAIRADESRFGGFKVDIT